MSVARKCDICGRLYEKYTLEKNEILGFRKSDDISSIAFVTDNDDGTFGYIVRNFHSMCPECMDAIIKLLEERKSGS